MKNMIFLNCIMAAKNADVSMSSTAVKTVQTTSPTRPTIKPSPLTLLLKFTKLHNYLAMTLSTALTCQHNLLPQSHQFSHGAELLQATHSFINQHKRHTVLFINVPEMTQNTQFTDTQPDLLLIIRHTNPFMSHVLNINQNFSDPSRIPHLLLLP